MVDRIYGPIRGAGTQIREREANREIVPAQLGSTVMIGVQERGKEDDIIVTNGSKSLLRKVGGLLDDRDFNAPSFASLEAPLNENDFYDHSQGSGKLIVMRVVPKTNDVTNDDRPDKSTMTVFNREDAPNPIGTLTALNGGRWAGQRENFLGVISGTPTPDDFPTPNQLQLDGPVALDFKRDEYKNGYVYIQGLDTAFKVVSNTSAGLFTFAADVDLPTLWAAAGPPTDYVIHVYRDNQNERGDVKSMSVHFKNGTLDPTAYFGMQVKVDGVVYLDYENLSMDTNSPYYWEDVVNTDRNNDLIEVADTYTGNRGASYARPANRCGLSDTLTTDTLTIADPNPVNVYSPVGGWVPSITAWTWGTKVLPQRLRITVTDDVSDAISVTSDIANGEVIGTGTLGVALDFSGPPDYSDFVGSITIAVDVDATTNDYFDLYLRPLPVDELIGGSVNPDTSASKSYTIIDNTLTTATISAIQDLTDGGSLSGGEAYMLSWPEQMAGGYDGYVAGMVTGDYESLLDSDTSPLKKLKSMNLGLVKLLIPGIAKPDSGGALLLQQKARDLCLAYNWEYRVEISDGITSDQDALDWVNDTFGRLDLATVFYPTFMYRRDPLSDVGSDAREVLTSTQGAQLGREALVAAQWDGYHKASAGIDVTLPLFTRSTQLGRYDDPSRLNEELLNPAGINAYRWSGNTIVAWGDRTLDNTTTMRWKHKREQLSHYENVLQENMDFAIFQLNDPEQDSVVLGVLIDFFLKEFNKRAIRGSQFLGGNNPAAIIKMDSENNTDATRAQGDQNVSISLRFADVVERLKILIGAMGVSEVF